MLGEKIKILREKENISQEKLAKHINVAPSTIGMYEQNRREPDFETLKKIADIFNVSTDYLLDHTDKREKDILDQPLQIAASMKDKTADLSNLSENDKEVIRQMIKSLNEKNKK
ncbi:MAG: helix-turn-helix transcriptional regulator [Clostridia bacterium]